LIFFPYRAVIVPVQARKSQATTMSEPCHSTIELVSESTREKLKKVILVN
jgi:hypothetical protein